MQIEDLAKKKILILGFQKEGKDVFNFLRKLLPEKEISISDRDEKKKDKKLKNVRWYLGKNYLQAIKKHEIVFKSPGIPIHLPEIEEAFRQQKITSATELFLNSCPGIVIGVTGTKGKGTTCNLIYKVLKAGGLKAHFVGNIGRPPLYSLFSAKRDDIFVYEMSSHQLYNLKISPHVAVFLNIYPEHLDYYKDFNEYLMAKANITLWQKKEDILIFNKDDKNVAEIAKKSLAKKIPVSGKYYSLDQKVAFKIGEIFKIEAARVKKAIKNYKGLPHRLEKVGKFKGITFYNDSLSTIPETTIFALDYLKDKVETLILGGYDRGLEFKRLAQRILKSKIKNLIFFPTTGERIWREILLSQPKKPKLFFAFFTESMKEAVKICYQKTKKNKICLLSPASPSFSLFRNYKERGNLFKKYVRYFGRKS